MPDTVMTNRIAFFADADDLIEHFDLEPSGEVVFDPHYNMSRGYHIPVITAKPGDEEYSIKRIRWGKSIEKNSTPPEVLEIDELKKLESESVSRALIPISGFYIWKDVKKKDHPFFVRKIDNTLLYVAAHIFKGDDEPYTEMLMSESNTLIDPISSTMPLIMKREFGKEWLQGAELEAILSEASSQFLITDLTVHRVTKKVKIESNNEPALIQPIPK